MLQVIVFAIILLALAIGGIAIKMFLIPDGKFTKTCGSTFDPDSGKVKACACSSGRPEDCENSKSEGPRTTDLIMRMDNAKQ